MASLGIDLGGTFARAAVVQPDGRIAASAKTALQDRQPSAVVQAIAKAAKDAMSAAGLDVEGCGVGVAGQLVRDTGIIAVAPNLGWRDVPFGQLLAAALGRTVRVVNDLSAAAWGELRAGAGRGARNAYVVYVGSGVGSALIIQGQLMTGASGVAGELGHTKVEPGGRRCGCGGLGCLEAYAGGHNLIGQMREAIAAGEKTMLTELCGGDLAKLNPALLEQAAEAKDPVARRIYDRAVAYLGLAIANQITVQNPERLILGGGVLNHAPGMRRKIVEAIERYSSETSRLAVKVVNAELGDDSGIIGAALLAVPGGSSAERAESAKASVLERELRHLDVMVRVVAGAPNGEVSAAPLARQAPEVFAAMAERYGEILDLVLRKLSGGAAGEPSAELRALAERVGGLGGGPRDVVDLHVRALRERTAGAPAPRVEALVAEGHHAALELMGHLAAYYRSGATIPP